MVKDPGYKMHFVCLECENSFKREVEHPDIKNFGKCSTCEGITYNCGRHFKPPKKEDKKQWKKVRKLISEGFWFQKVYEYSQETGGHHHIEYPTTLDEVTEFIARFSKDKNRAKYKALYLSSIKPK